jgi:DNA-binding CsgD family transcriptional regulator/PAS domain-containing protein
MGSQTALKTAMEAVHHIQDPTPPWDEILTASRELVGSDGATLMLFDGQHELLLMHQRGVDESAEREYREFYHRHDALAEAAWQSQPGRWWDTVELQRMEGAERHPFFADYLPRHRMRQVMAYIILGDQYRHAAISFQRETRKDDAVDALTHGDVATYLRALTDAIVLRESKGNLQLETLEAMLSSLGEAAFLVGPNGRIQRCSAYAYEMLRQGKMLRPSERSLAHCRPDVTKMLRDALSSCSQQGKATSFAAPTTWGHGIRFDVMPAPASYRLSTEPVLLVRMHASSAFAVPGIEDLAAFFALTPAEAKVLAALISGHSSREYAQSTGVHETTVRNQIASLMRKMSCSRQAEVIRLGSLLL